MSTITSAAWPAPAQAPAAPPEQASPRSGWGGPAAAIVSTVLLVTALGLRPGAAFATVALAAILIPVERLAALHRQQVFRRGWLTDLTHFFVNNLLATVGLIAVLVPLIVVSRRVLPAGLHDAVASQPGWVQFVEAVMLTEVAAYWAHRATHRVPVLWRFHAVHHSISEMDWLASGRLHPIDQVFSKACVVLPLLLLGFSKATFGGYLIFSAISAIVIHANVRWTFGPLRHVIGTPQFHHWHHANVPEAIDKNFAGQLPVLDRMFGTHHLPGNEWPSAYGIDEPVPPTYVGQLGWSFTHHPPPR